jgi:hypothetical protein
MADNFLARSTALVGAIGAGMASFFVSKCEKYTSEKFQLFRVFDGIHQILVRNRLSLLLLGKRQCSFQEKLHEIFLENVNFFAR